VGHLDSFAVVAGIRKEGRIVAWGTVVGGSIEVDIGGLEDRSRVVVDYKAVGKLA
jgi:hypothetical protein